MALKIGEPFIDFSLPNQQGETVHLNDFKGRWVVLFVYPKDDTPGCTIESKAFSESLPTFKKNNIEVLGLSADDVNSHKEFCGKYDLKMDLLSDPDGHLLGALGVGQSEFNGKAYWDRTTFVIDDSGLLRKVYYDVDPNGHDQAVFRDINEMQS
tara:strand:+ start:98 stop:559 length:462 start_codon:yes stop_codon:yes gene_type:complete